MGQTPVTVAAWKRYRAATGAEALPTRDREGRERFNEASGDDTVPVVMVDWPDAKKFCEWAGGRLPPGDYWESAARAGAKELTYSNLDDIAWYADNSGRLRIDGWALLQALSADDFMKRLSQNGNGPHPVAKKKPNAWGLYDMLGDVVEWTEEPDISRGIGVYRYVQRGCSWMHPAKTCRVTWRHEAPDVAQTLKTAPDIQSAARKLMTASEISGFRCEVDSWPSGSRPAMPK
jgi:formylglycine-generating enzyme required for sulfatase activity